MYLYIFCICSFSLSSQPKKNIDSHDFCGYLSVYALRLVVASDDVTILSPTHKALIGSFFFSTGERTVNV